MVCLKADGGSRRGVGRARAGGGCEEVPDGGHAQAAGEEGARVELLLGAGVLHLRVM